MANADVTDTEISRNEARLFFTMRLQYWPNKRPVTVFVLPDDHQLHVDFAKTILGLFPYQLRRVWDRQVHSVYSAILPMLACSAAQASKSLWERLQIHGFASQAVLQTSDNRWFGNSDQTSFDFTEIGLNASMRLNPKLLLAGQVLYQRAGEMYESDLALDYGLADITPLSSAEGRLGLRVGRIKNPLGLYNETRDVPFTHPGIFLPQVVYFDRVRNLVLSTDGAMIYGDRYTRFGNFSFTVSNGWSVIDDNVEWAYLNGDFPGDMKANSPIWLASLWYSDPSERFKLGLSGAMLSIKCRREKISIPSPESAIGICFRSKSLFDSRQAA